MADEQYVMGIDGGGSTVRVAIVTPTLQVSGQVEGATANPSVVGPEQAATTIQQAMRDALHAAHLTPGQIAAVGIGVAGAAARHSADWLREVVAAVVPQAVIVPSADYEIALVGALGQRQGVLILAGTGSLAYGINAAGDSALVGGWGYLIGDEGSGYWLGAQALRAVVQAVDGRGPSTDLTAALLDSLELPDALAVIPWLYHAHAARTREIARLAPLVLAAAAGDSVAHSLVTRAAQDLVQMAQTVMRRLGMPTPDIAFAGGLLSAENALSRALCAHLDLPAIPAPRHPPVIGAALLARLALEQP